MFVCKSVLKYQIRINLKLNWTLSRNKIKISFHKKTLLVRDVDTH